MARILTLDGGGTKLVGILLDGDMNTLGVGRAGGVNPSQTSLEDCRANVCSCLDQLLKDDCPAVIDTVYAVFVGPIEVLKEELNRRVTVNRFVACNECQAGLLAGGLRTTGLLALSGTGAGVSYNTDHGRVGVNHLGPIFGDQGSGTWMGLQALRAACRSRDGWGEKTVLWDLIREEWQTDDIGKMVSLVHTSPAPYRTVGKLTPVLRRACELGDEIALSIVREAGHVMALQTFSVIRRANVPENDMEITLCGGAWKTHPLMFETYKSEVQAQYPSADPRRPLFEHVCGGPVRELTERGLSREETLAVMNDKFVEWRWG